MRKLAALLCLCSVVALAQPPANYYQAADGKKGEALRSALNSCISAHTVLNYDALEDYYGPTDFRPDGTLWDIYSTCEYYMSDAGGTQDDFCQHWNKEHTVCQSWFGGESPMYSDIMHVLPTDARVNNLRSNYAYGETDVRNDKVTKGAPYALGHLGASTVLGEQIVYQPDDRYKGDIARIYFYMATCYMTRNFTKAAGGNTMFTYTNGKANLSGYSINLLMKWHRDDPVSYKEIARNDSVYKQQHNRNPFVDFPELAEYIWGNKTTDNFNLASALSAYDPNFVPVDTEGSDQANYAKYGIAWLVNGVAVRNDSVFKNHKPASLPATPVSCSATSNTFMGWSASPIVGTVQTAPSDLFADLTQAPAVLSDQTFYAVFAHKEQGVGMGSVAYTASFTTNDGYKQGQVVSSATAGKVSITFNQASASNPTKFFTTGNAIRCYAGSNITLTGATITKVEFTFGSNDNSNAITANSGTLSGAVWTGSSNNLVFTIGGDSKFRSFSAIKVTYDDNTTVFVYSDYLTHCGGSSDIEATEQEASPNRKLFINGQLYIQVGEQVYNLQGQRVK